MILEEIEQNLFSLQDTAYRQFQLPIIPNIDPETMLGVRTPELRKYARELTAREDVSVFLDALPHRYFEENQLHAFIISGIRDFPSCMKEVIRFLPYVDNWATCDQMSPKVFKKHKEELLVHIKEWIRSDHTYTIRFGLGMLMQHYLDEDFKPEYLELASSVHSEEYYVRMMAAWYFATALAKQYDEAVRYIEEKKLDVWTHNKAIQKAVESFRVSAEQKEYLKQFRIKKKV